MTRSERGIATLEAVGMVVLASVLVVGTAGAVEQRTGAVSDTVAWATCTVSGGSDCGGRGSDGASDVTGAAAPSGVQGDHTPGYETSVAATSDQPLCLPSTAVGPGPDAQLPTGETKIPVKTSGPTGGLTSGPSLSVDAERSITRSVDAPVLGADGRRTQRVNLSVDAQLALKGKQTSGKGGVEAKYAAGAKVSYSVTMPPELAARTAWDLPPLPTDPTSVPVGGSITIDGQTYTQLGLDASYQALRVSTEHTNGAGTSTGVTRVDETTVRVVVGPAEFVDDSVVLGAGVSLGGAEVSVGWADKQSWKDTHLATADFDISTPEGRAAYDEAVLRGAFPSEDGPGVSNVGTLAGAEWSRKAGWQLKTPRGTSGTVSTTESDVLGVTRYADGREVQTRQVRVGDKTYVARETVGVGGEVDPTGSTYTLALGDVSPEAATQWNQLYGNRPDLAVRTPQDMTITLDHQDLERMRADALDVLAHGIDTHPENDLASVPELAGGDVTADDVRAYVEAALARGETYDQLASRFGGLSGTGGDRYRLAFDVYAGDDHHVVFLAHRYGSFGSDAAVRFLTDWNGAVAEAQGRDRAGYGQVSCSAR